MLRCQFVWQVVYNPLFTVVLAGSYKSCCPSLAGSYKSCIRLLNPLHMHTRSKPPPFFMTLLSNICSSLTHVSPPRRPRGPVLPPPPLHNVQHSEVCKLSQSTHCSALHSCWLSTFHISHFFSKHIWISVCLRLLQALCA